MTHLQRVGGERQDRRDRTAKVVAKRTRVMKACGVGTDGQKLVGHRLAKQRGLGSCGNSGCSICGCERGAKRMAKKRARVEGRKEERP